MITQTKSLAENDMEKLDATDKLKLLRAGIEHAINHADGHRRVNQRKASYVRVATVLLSGIATVLLGLQIIGLEQSFKMTAFALGACVTVLNALEPFFNYRALWVEHESALASFHELQNELEYYVAGVEEKNLSMDKLNQFHKDYQSIWRRLNRAWVQYRRGEES